MKRKYLNSVLNRPLYTLQTPLPLILPCFYKHAYCIMVITNRPIHNFFTFFVENFQTFRFTMESSHVTRRSAIFVLPVEVTCVIKQKLKDFVVTSRACLVQGCASVTCKTRWIGPGLGKNR